MLVETKAKVGVFSIALGAYLPQFPTLVPEFEAQYEAFKKTIPDTVELVDGGMVTTKELSMKAGDRFRAADVDLVILQLLTYATSYNMLPAIRDLNVPVVLVNVQKLKAPDYANTDTPKWLGELYACGAVGEMVADLERAGKRHAVITGVVEGGDDYVAAEIAQWCKAAQVRRRFRYTNIAQIGRPYPGMMDLYIDETNLYNRMGLYTKQFDWEKMWAIADHITDENAIRAKAEGILATFDIAPDKDGKTATVETVVLLSHKKPDGHINVKVEFGEGEGKVPLDNIAKRAEEYKPKERVTYKMIKEYIEAKYGFKVHTAYIAEVKRDLGLPMYDAPNAVEELKQPRKHPTAEKVEAIKDALKHFEVI